MTGAPTKPWMSVAGMNAPASGMGRANRASTVRAYSARDKRTTTEGPAPPPTHGDGGSPPSFEEEVSPLSSPMLVSPAGDPVSPSPSSSGDAGPDASAGTPFVPVVPVPCPNPPPNPLSNASASAEGPESPPQAASSTIDAIATPRPMTSPLPSDGSTFHLEHVGKRRSSAIGSIVLEPCDERGARFPLASRERPPRRSRRTNRRTLRLTRDDRVLRRR